MTTTELTPADETRCQAEITTPSSFMRMGGPPFTTGRCGSKPTVIATEIAPGPDGQKGSMSLCESCLEAFKKQKGAPPVKVRKLG